jgi:hypothetical protein
MIWRRGLRKCKTGQDPILLSNDTAQRHPFMDAIISYSRLSFCREFVKLADYGSSNQIGSGCHLGYKSQAIVF